MDRLPSRDKLPSCPLESCSQAAGRDGRIRHPQDRRRRGIKAENVRKRGAGARGRVWRRCLVITRPVRVHIGLPEGVVFVGEAQAVVGARGEALQLVEGLGGVHPLRLLPPSTLCRTTGRTSSPTRKHCAFCHCHNE